MPKLVSGITCLLILFVAKSFGSDGTPLDKRDPFDKILCFTCMSNNVPKISKDMMRQNTLLPEYAESEFCDKFDEMGPTLDNSILLEQCDSSCVKLVAENKYLKIVIRGCLDKLYSPTSVGFPLQSNVQKSFANYCDHKTLQDFGVGSTLTETCICTSDFCNSANFHVFSRTGVIIYVVFMLFCFLNC